MCYVLLAVAVAKSAAGRILSNEVSLDPCGYNII